MTESSKRWRQDNRDKVNKWNNDYYHRNKERILAQQREYRAAHREEELAKEQAWYQKNRDAIVIRRKEQNQLLRQEIINHYGGICACCGENEMAFLVIDHINGGGNQHRKEIKRSGSDSFYRWIRDNNYPDGFQILCANCNMAKGKDGVCPHQEERNKK